MGAYLITLLVAAAALTSTCIAVGTSAAAAETERKCLNKVVGKPSAAPQGQGYARPFQGVHRGLSPVRVFGDFLHEQKVTPAEH